MAQKGQAWPPVTGFLLVLLSFFAAPPRPLRAPCVALGLLLLLGHKGVAGLWTEDCDRPLGMESSDIPNEAISASSSHDIIVGPHNARLNVDQNGGAWCPKVPVDTNSREYLQVDLGSVHVITATATQGRFANMKGMEYTEAYRLEYKRPGLPDFRTYISNGNEALRIASESERVILGFEIRRKFHGRSLTLSRGVSRWGLRVTREGLILFAGLRVESKSQGTQKR
ncbi:discoidin domain-containing receptor A-like [Penaeus indicus]|uniref:discoidin domain-containing receptor A-like n=1 Tax=Penaeus indicus TaxID=29960 RepID=UPI00300C1877